MERIELKVAQDHIEALAKFRNPIVAIEELIWNGLDADASKVEVTLTLNKASGLEAIRVVDDGHGIPRDACKEAFGSLGGSPKLAMRTTPKGRRPHGKSGQGRFRAFGIGRVVRWRSRFRDDGQVHEFSITGTRATLQSFEIGDAKAVRGKATGVDVSIAGIEENFPALLDADKSSLELSKRLALYLRQYPGITILYDGKKIDPVAIEDHSVTVELDVVDEAGAMIPASLTIIEWTQSVDRALYLCDENGFALDEKQPSIQAKGFSFTAYLTSPRLRELSADGLLAFDELNPTLKNLLDAARVALKHHFRQREAERSANLVEQWQQEEVYPYRTPPRDPLERAERQVFDVCAVKVHEYLPGFDAADRKNKQFTFRLIREALASNPTSLQTILREVLSLPPEQQNELAQILERTSLAAILNAAKVVLDRLKFLGSLDALCFGEFKEDLLERQQLHRILVQELWLFGEQYALGVDDESLKALLEKHADLLGRDTLCPPNQPVRDIGGKNRILDLMVYRRFPRDNPNTFEHLVIELKRPSCTLGQNEIGQIENYAFTIAGDERFSKDRVRWNFWLLGNGLDEFAKRKCQVSGKTYGHIHASEDGQVNIFVRTWSSIIDEAKWRYEFFRERLAYEVTRTEGLEYLRKKYPEFVPTADDNGGE